jgi:hypothetical protein
MWLDHAGSVQMSPTPSTNELISLGAWIVLRDGSRVRVREGHGSDRELLLRGFEHLSRVAPPAVPGADAARRLTAIVEQVCIVVSDLVQRS